MGMKLSFSSGGPILKARFCAPYVQLGEPICSVSGSQIEVPGQRTLAFWGPLWSCWLTAESDVMDEPRAPETLNVWMIFELTQDQESLDYEIICSVFYNLCCVIQAANPSFFVGSF